MSRARTTARPAFASLAAMSCLALTLAACADSSTAPSSPLSPAAATLGRVGGGGDGAGGVYTLTNAPAGNGVIAFHRSVDGALTPIGTFATGGSGTGGTIDPLASQYSVVLNASHDALFAVNAGSDQISSFSVAPDGALALASTVSSGGSKPVSLAVHDNLLYALNTGDNTVSGFRITGGGRLVALPHTTRTLASGASGAAAIHFTPDGHSLVVTERVSNRLEVFAVQPDDRLGDPVVSAASGGASFGFDISANDQPVVSETHGALTSYALGHGGTLTPITASISTNGVASCWVTITSDGRFAYTTNAGSSTIAGFAIDGAGHLTALVPGAVVASAGAGATPIDLDHVGSRFIYTLNTGRGTIGAYAIGASGTLTSLPGALAGAPASGLQGLAAY